LHLRACLTASLRHFEKFNMNNLVKLDHMIRQLRGMIELDKLHNFRQSDLSVRDYIARFEDLAHRCNVREHRSLTITRFVSSLSFDIRRAIISSSYGVDFVEDVFDFALKIDLTFKEIVSAKA